MIDIQDVSKAYDSARVVDRVTVSIPTGGVTAVIGPNGAGKSTLLSIAARLLPMDSGRVTVGGLDVATTPGNALARKLAILRQDNHITPRLTVEELVAFGRFPHSNGRLTPDDHGKIEQSIGYVGMSDLRNRHLDELSGGQRQRAFVAMVLAQDPEYLLLDEPLNNLDMKHAAEMMRLLRRAADELGKTVVVVLHDINIASHYADSILAMKDGRVVIHAPPGEIMRSDVLAAIYDMHIPIHEIGGTRIAIYYA